MPSFGAWLARERELRALSRADVARTTRLPPASVAALEEDRFEALPGEAFTVGYIRSYASCIGLSGDEAVLRYHEARQEAAPQTTGAARQRPRRLLLAAGAAGASGLAFALWHLCRR